MKFTLIDYNGFEPAMLGAMLSYGKTNFEDLENWPRIKGGILERFEDLSEKLVKSGAGHDKFLEQVQYWIGIRAPLYWWKQFDTYRVGVSKSSESTMHKSWKEGLKQDDFEGNIFPETLDRLNEVIIQYKNAEFGKNKKARDQAFETFIRNLSDGYLQTRMVQINAKTLRNIYRQRCNHKLKEWKEFCSFVKTLPHNELITIGEEV